MAAYNPNSLTERELRPMSKIFGKLQVGAVRYLNTKPLVYGLKAAAPEFDLLFDLPSRLSDRLASGDLDVPRCESRSSYHGRSAPV